MSLAKKKGWEVRTKRRTGDIVFIAHGTEVEVSTFDQWDAEVKTYERDSGGYEPPIDWIVR